MPNTQTSQTVAPPTPVGANPQSVKTETLSWRFDQAIADSANLQDLLGNLARIIHDQTDCLALWFSLLDETGQPTAFRPVPSRPDDPLWEVVEDLTRSVTQQAVSTGQQHHSAFQPNAQLVVTPVGRALIEAPYQPIGSWVACFSTESQTVVRQNWLMSMVSQATLAWLSGKSISNVELRAKQLANVITTIAALGKTENVAQTCLVLCNQLRKHFSTDLVAVSMRQSDGSFHLEAISDVEQVDAASDWTKAISAACAAAGNEGGLVRFPNAAPENPDTPAEQHTALKEFCENHGVQGCVGLPLVRVDGSIGGSVLIVTDSTRAQDPTSLDHFNNTIQLLGSHVDVVTRANRSSTQLIKDQWKRVKAANWTRNGLLALTATALILCLPLPYRIKCDCTIQPVMRRYLAAPYDGILDRAIVELGDVVSAGDVLARMDQGNLRIELSGVEAELAAARKKRDSALAQGEVAQSQIARSEMRRLQAQIDLLRERLKNLEIRSPIDGLVVAGDLEKAEGAPLEMGQTIFEVAPLEQMVVEVAIDESEIGYARPGMTVDVKLNAFPFRSWEGVVKSISPSTEIINDKSAFVAEVEIANEELKLKPGMEGTAKIRGDRACLGWSLFHRPWESVRYWTVW